MVFELATLCACPEAFARSFLRERFRRPLSASLDVPVIHDGKTLVSHGPPSSWAPGVAQRVQNGALQLGVVRVRLVVDDAESRDGPVSLSTLSSAPPVARQSTFPLASRLAAGRLKVGVHAHPGGLDYMEDENVVHTTADFAFFCVYDGHGGTHAAQFCRDRLHFNIMASPAFNAGDARTALLEGFAKTEADLLLEQGQALAERAMATTQDAQGAQGRGSAGGGGAQLPPSGSVPSVCCGSTALVALLRADSLHLAWLGDCRAVLCRGGKAVDLTVDHSLAEGAAGAGGAEEGTERARVLREGGQIEAGRLSGFLEVARAFGDVDYLTGCKPVGLSGLPELSSQRLEPEDEFVLLGSDGLWSVVNSDAAVALARAELQAYGDANMASEKLVEVALRRNADDNVTAMVVLLRPIEQEVRQRPRLALAKAASVPVGLHARGGDA
jgi:serine/threonine protein phosphatase PrpC